MQKTKIDFEKKFYSFIIILLFLAGVFIFSGGLFLNKDYFIKYSPDKSLKDNTIKSINKFRTILMVVSFLIFLTILSLFKGKKRTLNFIKKYKKTLQNLTLLLIVLFIIFMLSEITLRVVYNETTFSGGFGPGSLKFNKKYVEINKDGMRDRDFDIEKLNNTFRIAIIGDSFAFGSGIKNVSDIYSKVLEEDLNNIYENYEYEVLNFGIMGLSTDDELKIIKDKALKYSPDIILIGYVSNDFINVEPIKYQEHLTIFPGGFWIRNFLFTYALTELKMNRFLENRGLKKDGLFITLDKLKSEKNIAHNKNLFKEINRISNLNNVEVVLVNFPIIYNLNSYPLLPINDFVKKVAEENEFLYLDLTPIYAEYSEEELVVNDYDSHPNEFGHKIASDSILEKLKNEGLI